MDRFRGWFKLTVKNGAPTTDCLCDNIEKRRSAYKAASRTIANSQSRRVDVAAVALF